MISTSAAAADELINTALAPYGDDLVLTTKVGPARDASGEWIGRPRPEDLRGQVEENLRQLGRDHLDVVNPRLIRSGLLSDLFTALAELREAGLIRHLGISNVQPEHLDEALAIAPVVCVQNRYGIGSKLPGSAEVLRKCGEQGIAFVPDFAIAGEGREQGTSAQAEHDDVLAIAKAHDASAAQVRIAWTLAQGPHYRVGTSASPGRRGDRRGRVSPRRRLPPCSSHRPARCPRTR